MSPEQFLKEARARINDDPMSRLSAPARTAIDDPDCIFDVHCHIFDKKCLNIRYLALRFAGSFIGDLLGFESTGELGQQTNHLKKDEETLYKEIEAQSLLQHQDSPEEWARFEQEINAVVEAAEENEGFESVFGYEAKGLKQAWKVLRKASMAEVWSYYQDSFSIRTLPELADRPLVAGVLMMDLETGWKMKTQTKFYQQITELKWLAKEQPILPFLAVDPRRAELSGQENLYELFLNAFAEDGPSFFGVKCYPALGYLPSDARLDPIFQICAEKNIPVTTHCGGEAVSTFEKKVQIKNSTGYRDFKIPGDSRVERARFLNDPAHWDSVVHKHKALRLNMAHFTSESFWKTFIEKGEEMRIAKIMELASDPELRVFTDFSFNVINLDLFDALLGVIKKDKLVKDKVMFGTDFWVVLPSGDLIEKQQKFFTTLTDFKESLIKDVPRAFLFGNKVPESVVA